MNTVSAEMGAERERERKARGESGDVCDDLKNDTPFSESSTGGLTGAARESGITGSHRYLFFRGFAINKGSKRCKNAETLFYLLT